MAPIVSFHLIRYPRRSAAVAMAAMATDRPRLARTEGLAFWRLLGTARGSSTAPGADLTRWALFAVWDDEVWLDRFLGGSPVADRWHRSSVEHATVRLAPTGGHGRWGGVDPLALRSPFPSGSPDAPVAVLTRATVRPSRWREFRAATGPVDRVLAGAPGLLRVVGVGEAPVLRQATFSLWQRHDDVRRFAYGDPAHAEVVRRTRRERWYGEELFVRFTVLGAEGRWDGTAPLAPSS